MAKRERKLAKRAPSIFDLKREKGESMDAFAMRLHAKHQELNVARDDRKPWAKVSDKERRGWVVYADKVLGKTDESKPDRPLPDPNRKPDKKGKRK